MYVYVRVGSCRRILDTRKLPMGNFTLDETGGTGAPGPLLNYRENISARLRPTCSPVAHLHNVIINDAQTCRSSFSVTQHASIYRTIFAPPQVKHRATRTVQ